MDKVGDFLFMAGAAAFVLIAWGIVAAFGLVGYLALAGLGFW